MWTHVPAISLLSLWALLSRHALGSHRASGPGRTPALQQISFANGKYRLASVLAFYRKPLAVNNGESIQYTTSQWRMGMGDGLAYPYWAGPTSWRGADCVLVFDRAKPELVRPVRRLFDRLDVIDDPRLRHLNGGYSMAIGRGLRDLPARDLQSPGTFSGD